MSADLIERLRAHPDKAVARHWEDWAQEADTLMREAAAALEAEASEGERRGLERVTADALALSCDDQFTLATNLASNIGYELTEEPLHPDTPKPGAFEAMVERALIPEAPAREEE